MHRKGTFLFILIFLLVLAMTTILINNTKSFAEMASTKKVSFNNGEVICDILNVRLGPGLDFPVIYKIHKGDNVRVFTEISGWYLVQNDENCTGMVSADYIKSAVDTKNNTTSEGVAKPIVDTLQSSEKKILDMVNTKRKSLGLSTLKIDATLDSAAKAKAKEMVNKNYFSHNSPTFGSPFNMMTKYGIKYRVAGENIAGSTTIKDAFDAWMKSKSHKDNILNKNYNYTGIGVCTSKTYGSIIVQEFAGR